MSLSGADFDSVVKTAESGQTLFMAALFILIGCCIDVGKYLFWVKRRISRYFKALSLVLMVFSWLASCAFFLSSEIRLIKETQQRSPEYVSLQKEIDGLQKNIAIEEQLLNKRLGSSYHRQWEQAQNSAARIERFQAEIAAKQSALSQVGLSSSVNQLETTKLFAAISHTLNIDLDTVRTVGYAVLALLLEVSTLGMISLAGAEREVDSLLSLVLMNQSCHPMMTLPLMRHTDKNWLSSPSISYRARLGLFCGLLKVPIMTLPWIRFGQCCVIYIRLEFSILIFVIVISCQPD